MREISYKKLKWEYQMKRKCLAIGIILLFVGIVVAPTINFQVVKASQGDDLVEVTSQACGIQGYGDTTVTLTRQQYNDLEQYLVEFRARLNQTAIRGEAIPLFKDAVVELNRYGLLPRGMSVERAQRLVIGEYQNQRLINYLDRLWNKNQYNISSNLLCLVAGESDLTFVAHRFSYWLTYGGFLLYLLFFLLGWDSAYEENIIGEFLLLTAFFFLGVSTLGFLLEHGADMSPISLMEVFGIGYTDGIGHEIYYGSGWLKSVGVLGIKSWNGSLLGNLPGLKLPYYVDGLYIYPAMWGFCGIKIRLDEDGCQKSFFGTALAVSVDNQP